MQRGRHEDRSSSIPIYLALGVGLGAVAVGYAFGSGQRHNRVDLRPPDDSPRRAGRAAPPDGARAIGRTVTINRPRAELFAFWSDFSNLPKFMQAVTDVSVDGTVVRWKIAAPFGQTVQLETRITETVPDEVLAWETTGSSDMKAEGRVTFRDAPAGRGTELEAQMAYHPPMGEIGVLLGKGFQTDPLIQGRRELRRFKMLMEAGEIATSKNTKTEQ